MTMNEMTKLANKPGMPVTADPRAIAARAFIEALHSENAESQKTVGAALNKAVKRFGKP